MTKDKPIAQAKIFRVLNMVAFLLRGHRTIEQFAERFDISHRTVYRYLDLIDEMGFGLEQDFQGRFFIVDFKDCPLCGEKHKSRTHKNKRTPLMLEVPSPAFFN